MPPKPQTQSQPTDELPSPRYAYRTYSPPLTSPVRIPTPPTLSTPPTPRLPVRMTPEMVQRVRERREVEKAEKLEREKAEKERLSRIRGLVGRGLAGGGEREREKEMGVGKGKGKVDEVQGRLGSGVEFRGVVDGGEGGGGWIERGGPLRKRIKIEAATAAERSGAGAEEGRVADARACEEGGEKKEEGKEKFGDHFWVSGDVTAWMNVGRRGKGGTE